MLKITVFILAFCVFGVGLYVHSALLGYEIVALKEDITTLENDNQRLEYNIAELSSLERVQIEAEKKLGMFRPQSNNMMALLCEPQNVPINHVSGQTTTQQQTASLKRDYQVVSSILDQVGLNGSFE
jgi:cell division protein FtsL